MMVNKMTVDGDAYFLAPEQDVDETKHQIVDAVQHGGGMVDVVVAGNGTVSLLVSQAARVTFEEIEAPDPQPVEQQQQGLYFDEFSTWDELGL